MLHNKDIILRFSNKNMTAFSLFFAKNSFVFNIFPKRQLSNHSYMRIGKSRTTRFLMNKCLAPNIRYNQYQAFQNEAEIDMLLNKNRHLKDKENNLRKSSNYMPSILNNGNTFHEKVLIGYSRDQMCSLVFDVKNYSKFLPWCLNSEIIVPTPSINKTIDKNLNLNLKLLKKKYETKQPSTTEDEKVHQSSTQKSFKARLDIGYPPFKESYISHVSMVRPYQITSISRDTNLFEYLINEWKFLPRDPTKENENNIIEDSCIIDFYVSFKFRSILYSKFSDLFMDQIFGKMVEAFFHRAQTLHGKPSIKTSKVK
jgi:coenzyme Q-binding protein COQ10